MVAGCTGLFAQPKPQNPFWIFGKEYVDFTTSPPSKHLLFGGNPNTPVRSSTTNTIFDECGVDPIFYTQDDRMKDKNGLDILTPVFWPFLKNEDREVLIIPSPGPVEKYYLVSTSHGYENVQGTPTPSNSCSFLTYTAYLPNQTPPLIQAQTVHAVPDPMPFASFSGVGNPYGLWPGSCDPNISVTGTRLVLGATDYIPGQDDPNRYFYMLSNAIDDIGFNTPTPSIYLYRYTVNGADVWHDPDPSAPLGVQNFEFAAINQTNPTGTPFYHADISTELEVAANDQRVFWGEDGVIRCASFCGAGSWNSPVIYDFTAYQNTWDRIVGLEVVGDKLIVSAEEATGVSNGLYFFDLGTSANICSGNPFGTVSLSTFVPSTLGTLDISQIEYAYNEYAYASDGTKLIAYTTSGTPVTSQNITINTPILPADNGRFWPLPDQIDGYIYYTKGTNPDCGGPIGPPGGGGGGQRWGSSGDGGVLQIAPSVVEMGTDVTVQTAANVGPLRVIDMTGRVVWRSETETGSVRVPTTTLRKGSYLIEHGGRTARFVVR